MWAAQCFGAVVHQWSLVRPTELSVTHISTVCVEGLEDDEVQLREQHSSFRMGAGQRLRRSTSKAAAASGSINKGRRRWMDNGEDDASADVGDVTDLIPAGRPETTNTGHIVRMRRGEAWSKFLAYEGCCQVGA